MNNKLPLEITADFDNFKNGLVNRILNNYEDTVERQQAIDKIADITLPQVIKNNSFCKEVLPILWDANPPQNERDYCNDSPSVYIRIIGGFNKELKVRSYFHGNSKGNQIKGRLLQSEVDKITDDNRIDVIKESAAREVIEESNIQLEFINDNLCILNIYNNVINGTYEIVNNNKINITLSPNSYELLKQSFYDNFEEHKTFMENTGEISGIIL